MKTAVKLVFNALVSFVASQASEVLPTPIALQKRQLNQKRQQHEQKPQRKPKHQDKQMDKQNIQTINATGTSLVSIESAGGGENHTELADNGTLIPTESISEPISGVSLEYINEGDMHAAHADNGTSIPKKLISLFVRTFHGSKDEYHSFLLKTAAEFWPALEHEQLEVVLDAGSTLDADMGKTIQHTWPYPSVSYATIPNDLRKNGHVLQQEAYLYADIYTQNRSEFVGMVDTDTLFSRAVKKDDIFDPENGKPFVIAQIGEPKVHFWEIVPRITAEVLKLDVKVTLRGMSHFPVVVKCAHLLEFRNHVEALHGEPFAEAWRHAWIRGRKEATVIFGAFDLIVTYLWHYHRDDYSFRLQRRAGAKDRSAGFDDIIRQFPNLTTPLPRVSEHGHYRHPLRELRLVGLKRGSREATSAEVDRVILRGKCLSSACLPSSLECANYFDKNVKSVDVKKKDLGNALWTFGGSDWRFDKRANEIQEARWPWYVCQQPNVTAEVNVT